MWTVKFRGLSNMLYQCCQNWQLKFMDEIMEKYVYLDVLMINLEVTDIKFIIGESYDMPQQRNTTPQTHEYDKLRRRI